VGTSHTKKKIDEKEKRERKEWIPPTGNCDPIIREKRGACRSTKNQPTRRHQSERDRGKRLSHGEKGGESWLLTGTINEGSKKKRFVLLTHVDKRRSSTSPMPGGKGSYKALSTVWAAARTIGAAVLKELRRRRRKGTEVFLWQE